MVLKEATSDPHRRKQDGRLEMLLLLGLAILLELPGSQCQPYNAPPYFVPGHDMSKFSLPENTPVNTPVYQLKGVDPEGRNLKYSISGPHLSVDRDTGLVRLVQALDREVLDKIEVIISITDEAVVPGSEPNIVSLGREIPVKDFNDFAPHFIGRPYSASLSENTPVGTTITISPPIQAIDRDEGINAEIKFECFIEKSNGDEDTCETFDIFTQPVSAGLFNATIVLRKFLDFETRSSYVLNIKASDGSILNPLSASASVAIEVMDIQDQLPYFVDAPYSITLPENSPKGVQVLSVEAKDGDFLNPRDVFIITNDKHFEVRKVSAGKFALFTTDLALDREDEEIQQNGGIYMFELMAFEDGGSTSEFGATEVTVQVTDVDDNPPAFNRAFFNISIPENLENGTALPGLSMYVQDLDLLENSHYGLRVQASGRSKGVFDVSPTQYAGRTPVTIRILDSSKLDFDNPEDLEKMFEFIVISESKNGNFNSSSRVSVYLSDVNDNFPQFKDVKLELKVAENVSVGHLVDDISASDKDSGDFGRIQYLVKGFGADFFGTNSSSGGVYVKKPLDYETQKNFVLTLVAMDGGKKETSVNLFIEVEDVNDNAPRFEDSYSRTVREGTSVLEPQLFVKARDIDGPKQGNGRVKYSIEGENSISGHVFRIDSETGELLVNQPLNSMDTERGEYEITVAATDFGVPPLKNTTVVKVRVGIIGNQRPVFRPRFVGGGNNIPGPSTYRVSIPENAKPGDNVTWVQATDPDGSDSLLTYRIVGSGDNFDINEKSGLITVSKVAVLDRDSNAESYAITVNAIDSGNPFPETATTTVFVSIKDVNDKPPRFVKTSYASFVSEDIEVGSEVIQVQAKDTDSTAQLFYEITDVNATTKSGTVLSEKLLSVLKDSFSIDNSTGKIFVEARLSYDTAASIFLTTKVTDVKAEVNKDSQFDTVEVLFYIQPYKTTNPIFLAHKWSPSNSKISIEVDEEVPVGKPVFKFEAEDPISQAIITDFEIETPDPGGFFVINERTGELSLSKRLDYEALKTPLMTLTVRALSSSRKRSSLARVAIEVRNVNDNSPVFSKPSYKATILESTRFPETIMTIKATDGDAFLTEKDKESGYSEVLYKLNGLHANLFTIDNTTGVIKVAQNVELDRESMSSIHLVGVAEDSHGNAAKLNKGTVDIVIELLDVNDTPPMFDKQLYTAVVVESAPIGTLVGSVSATDVDEGPGGEVRYEILNEGDAMGFLRLDSITGNIFTKQLLTGKGREAPFEVVIRALDNGDQVPKQVSLFSDVRLLLYVGDTSANDGIPFFVSPKINQAATISEDAPVGSPVFHIIAEDPDSPDSLSGKIQFRILPDSEDSRYFRINSVTGLITSTKSLDRETKDSFNVLVEVSDMGFPVQAATRVLNIQVLDVDDHQPRFEREKDAKPVVMEVLEEVPVETVVGTVKAVDEDIGENGAINYAIVDGNELGLFALNRTEDNKAVILTADVIDRELHESFVLTIKCFKLGETVTARKPYEAEDKSEIMVKIVIADIDDHLPEFMGQETVGVKHNVPINTFITTVRAFDEDSSAGPINLTIQDVNFVSQFYRKSNITVDLTSVFVLLPDGELRSQKSLHEFVDGYFELNIRANNSNSSMRFTDQILKVFIIREKSLLKFVFSKPPSDIISILPQFTNKTKFELAQFDLDLTVFEAQVLSRPDSSLDFTSTSSCFQLSRHGSPLVPHEMQKIMNSEAVQAALVDAFTEFSVTRVDNCSENVHTGALTSVSSGLMLVFLAGVIGLASFAALVSTYCLLNRTKLKPISMPTILVSRGTSQSDLYANASQPVIVPSEPPYGPL